MRDTDAHASAAEAKLIVQLKVYRYHDDYNKTRQSVYSSLANMYNMPMHSGTIFPCCVVAIL